MKTSVIQLSVHSLFAIDLTSVVDRFWIDFDVDDEDELPDAALGENIGAKKRRKLEMKAEKRAQRQAELAEREEKKERQARLDEERKQKKAVEKMNEEERVSPVYA